MLGNLSLNIVSFTANSCLASFAHNPWQLFFVVSVIIIVFTKDIVIFGILTFILIYCKQPLAALLCHWCHSYHNFYLIRCIAFSIIQIVLRDPDERDHGWFLANVAKEVVMCVTCRRLGTLQVSQQFRPHQIENIFAQAWTCWQTGNGRNQTQNIIFHLLAITLLIV